MHDFRTFIFEHVHIYMHVHSLSLRTICMLKLAWKDLFISGQKNLSWKIGKVFISNHHAPLTTTCHWLIELVLKIILHQKYLQCDPRLRSMLAFSRSKNLCEEINIECRIISHQGRSLNEKWQIRIIEEL